MKAEIKDYSIGFTVCTFNYPKANLRSVALIGLKLWIKKTHAPVGNVNALANSETKTHYDCVIMLDSDNYNLLHYKKR